MSVAEQIRELAFQPASKPEAIARKLKCPVAYVLKVGWRNSYHQYMSRKLRRRK